MGQLGWLGLDVLTKILQACKCVCSSCTVRTSLHISPAQEGHVEGGGDIMSGPHKDNDQLEG